MPIPCAPIPGVVLPVEGFLGTGAPFWADINLVLQMMMAGALLGGAFLARAKRYRAHGITQTMVLLLNLVMIATVMWPSTREQVIPRFPGVFGKRYLAAASIHAVLGTVAEILGLFVAVVAGTPIVPERLRFRNWKRWMQAELVLWWTTLLSGIATYSVWYLRR